MIRVRTLFILIFYGIYFFSLLGMYFYFINPIYEYMGFDSNFTIFNLYFSIFTLIFIIPIINLRSLPSSFFINMAVTLILIPSLVIYTAAGLPIWYAATTTLSIIIISITHKISTLPSIRIAYISNIRILNFIIFLSIGVIGSIFLFGGLRHLNFNITAVYDFRKEAAQNIPGIFAYINSWVGKIVIPFGLIFAVRNREWFFVALLCILSIMLFGLTSHKSPLFYPFVVLFIYSIANSRYLVHYFILSLIALLLVSSIDTWLLFRGAEAISAENIPGWFSSLFVRRAILVPSLLNWNYLEFFSNADKYFWAESKITFGLIQTPFDLRAPQLIGLEYFNNADMSANTGWIGSGYANAGIWGVVFYSFVIGVLFAFLDRYALRLGTRMVVSLFTLPVFVLLTSTDFLTMLLTHGLLISLLLLAMIKPEIQQRYEGERS